MKLNHAVKLVISLLVPLAVGWIGTLFMSNLSRMWYVAMLHPPLTPPGWVFGPIWTTLYLLMGFAAFLVWRVGTERKEVQRALVIYFLQLVLNGIWTPVFFGFMAPALALVVIVLLWIAVATTFILFFRVRNAAGLLLLPYLLWVSFATYLNFGFWTMN